MNKAQRKVLLDYIIGITYKNDTNVAIAWFNGDYIHSVPLALNTWNRALVKSFGDYDIRIRNKPFLLNDVKPFDLWREVCSGQIYQDLSIMLALGVVYSI
jgi:hypothetical protein